MARRARKEKLPPTLKVELIQRGKGKEQTSEYTMLDELVGKFHPHLADAQIALAWAKGWKRDVDGRLHLGKAAKANELGQQLHGFDWVLLLNQQAWTESEFTIYQRRALLDHLLCHCQVKRTKDGGIALGPADKDGKRRPVWRVRHHDVEEFIEVVKRHGVWKGDLEQLVERIADSKDAPLLAAHRDGKAAE